MKQIRVILFILPILLTMPFFSVSAQEADGCTLLDEAFTTIGTHCSELERNQVCYAHSKLDAQFYEEPVTRFSEVADITDIRYLETLSGAPYSTETQEWGLAVMRVQANLPNTIPGQGVLIILMGDTEIQNEVTPENAFVPETVLTARVLVNSANIRSAPAGDSPVIGSVAGGTDLDADVRTANSEWVRVVSTYGPGWISTSIVDIEGDLNTLAVQSANSQTPMQAFSISTGLGAPTCTEVPPSGVMIQGPSHINVRMQINGVEFVSGSTYFVRVTENQMLQAITIDGSVRSENVVLPPGFTAERPLTAEGNAPTGAWESVRPVTAEELALIEPLNQIDPSLLNYAVEVPTNEEIMNTVLAIENASPANGGAGNGTAPVSGGAQCRGLVPTSPVGGMPNGQTNFYWNPAARVDSYRLVVYADGNQIFSVDAAGTSIPVNTSSFPAAGTYSWQVLGIVNGSVVCTSPSSTSGRDTTPIVSGYGRADTSEYVLAGPSGWLSLALIGSVGIGLVVIIRFYAGLIMRRVRRVRPEMHD